MSYLLEKDKPQSAEYLSFSFPLSSSLGQIVAGVFCLILGLFSAVFFLYTGNVLFGAGCLFLIFGSPICFFQGLSHLFSPKALILYEEGLWVADLGLIPWPRFLSLNQEKILIPNAFGYMAVSYSVFFETPSNMQDLPRRYSRLLKQKKRMFHRIPRFNLRSDTPHDNIKWHAKNLSLYMSDCAGAAHDEEKLQKLLIYPQHYFEERN